jgi:hypothetical protein
VLSLANISGAPDRMTTFARDMSRVPDRSATSRCEKAATLAEMSELPQEMSDLPQEMSDLPSEMAGTAGRFVT